MNRYLIPILIALLSCSSSQEFFYPYTDMYFDVYQKNFQMLIKDSYKRKVLKNTVIRMVDINSGKDSNGYTVSARCNYLYTVYPEVEVDVKYWNTSSELSKEFTIYHELGHCVCNLQHTEIKEQTNIIAFFENLFLKIGLVKRKGYLKDGCPASIMHPYDFDESCMSEHYNYYMNELFKDCNGDN